MGKNNLKTVVFGVIFFIGSMILMNSINLGDYQMSGIMMDNGGSMDTGKYLVYLEQAIAGFRFMGYILSMLGGLGLLLTTNTRL
jgi:hypothetical protein